MEIKNKEFFFLETSDFGDFLFQKRDEAVEKLINIAKDEKILSDSSRKEMEKLKIHKIDASQEEWEIQELDWSEIVVDILEILA